MTLANPGREIKRCLHRTTLFESLVTGGDQGVAIDDRIAERDLQLTQLDAGLGQAGYRLFILCETGASNHRRRQDLPASARFRTHD